MISVFYKTNDKEKIALLDRRNKLLLAFFHANGINNIQIMGNAQNPMIIYNNEVRLACYVSNFNLILLEKTGENKILGMLAMDREKKVLDAESILLDFLYNSEHADVYRIRLKALPQLFLCGYTYKDKEHKLGREPVFSALDARIFQSIDKANEIIKKMPRYKLEAV